MPESGASRVYHIRTRARSGWEDSHSISAEHHTGGEDERNLVLDRAGEVVARFSIDTIQEFRFTEPAQPPSISEL